jgi:hypothetical protein
MNFLNFLSSGKEGGVLTSDEDGFRAAQGDGGPWGEQEPGV